MMKPTLVPLLGTLAFPLALAAWGLSFGSVPSSAQAGELWIGAAAADITPDQPVPLTGGSSVRIAREVFSRCTANVLALESRDGQRALDQAILELWK